MAFVAEDGTGLTTATSLLSVADADAYFEDRFITTWVGNAIQKQAALVKATDYVEATYTFRGQPVRSDQALSWPRTDAWDKNGLLLRADTVPQPVKAAVAELALLALSAPLVTNVKGDDRVSKVKAGSVEVEYEAGAKDAGTRYTFVDRLLSDLTSGGTGMVRMTSRGW